MTARQILLVEDSADDAAVVESLLRRACPACRLHVVSDAAGAIAYLAGDGEHADREAFPVPALILLDLILPGPSGLSVLAWRCTRPEALAIPVVVLTASRPSADLHRAYELGADSYLVKPVTAQALADTVTSLAPLLDSPVRVLVVDDSADDRRLAAGLLRRGIPGVEINEATSVEDLDRAARGEVLDAVVTDFDTGGFSGVDTLRAVKATWPSCPVIVLTGNATPEDLTRVLRAGADDYVLKDQRDLARLAAAVRSAIAEARARRALADSEARFRDLVEHSHDLICTHDLEGRLLTVNPAVSRLTGYSPEEFARMNLRDALAPEVRDAFPAYLAAMRDKGAAKGLMVVLTKSGTRRIWEYDNTLRTEGIAAPVVRGLARDVTERVEAERALRESERRYRHIFEHAIEGIFQTTPQGRFLRVNPALAAMFGYASPDEMLASVSDIGRQVYVDPTDRERFKRVLDREGFVERFEAQVRRKDGTPFWISINAQPVRDAQGRVQYFEGTNEDITERRRAEAALKASKERYRTILQSIIEGYYEVDLRGTMTFCNDAMVSLLGYTRDELIGLNNRTCMDEATAARVYATFNRVYRTGETDKAFGWELLRKDGQRIQVETSVSLIRAADGAPAGFRGLVRDVTERKHVEAQLLQAQKMEAVGRLAGGVAHDINNLHQALLAWVQVLRGLHGEPQRLAAVAAELEAAIKRGAGLTRQLLLFSRRETVKLERLDLNEVVTGSAQMLRRLVAENITFNVELADHALPVNADRGQLEQVLMNLVVNAWDAMPEGGTLAIRAGRDDDSMVWLEVSDTGCGIPEETRDHIFEPFFTTKAGDKGTGLGLAVVHGIVSGLGGRIEVDSKVGSGSRFKVVVPRLGSGAYPAVSELAPPPTALEPGRGERILVVEDERAAREGLAEILRSLSYEVTAVGTGEEAGLIPELPAFDVLLTDLMLPGVSGAELAVGLQDRWPSLRVVLMSGYTEDEAVRRGIRAGEVRFLQKPFDISTLAREIRVALGA